MARPELGVKRACQACGAKFYDLSKTPIVCPKCATVFVVPAAFAGRVLADSGAHAADNDSIPDDVELVSLEDADAEASGKIKGLPDDADLDLDDDLGNDDDVFLEEDEENDGDVVGLIGGDLDDEEET